MGLWETVISSAGIDYNEAGSDLARLGRWCVLDIRVMSEMENCFKKFPLDHGESPASHSEDVLHFFPSVFEYREQDVLSPLSSSIS